MRFSIWELLGTECPNTFENCVHFLHCLRLLFYMGDCGSCMSCRACLSNDSVRLLSETWVTSLNIISFFLLQRSVSSHGSSHLFTITSKFCNRMKTLLPTFLCCAILQDTFYYLSDHIESVVKLNDITTYYFKLQFLNWEESVKSRKYFYFKCYVWFLCNIFQKTYFIFLEIKNI